MGRKPSKPIEKIPTSPAAEQVITELRALLDQIIDTAAHGGDGLVAADRRRVWTWLSAEISYAGQGPSIAGARVPFVQQIGVQRYLGIIAGLDLGNSQEQVAAEAGISKSAVGQILLRHSASAHPDPARREQARQRRRAAEQRAVARKVAPAGDSPADDAAGVKGPLALTWDEASGQDADGTQPPVSEWSKKLRGDDSVGTRGPATSVSSEHSHE